MFSQWKENEWLRGYHCDAYLVICVVCAPAAVLDLRSAASGTLPLFHIARDRKGQTIVMDQRSKMVYVMTEKQMGTWRFREPSEALRQFVHVSVTEMSVGSAAAANLVLFLLKSNLKGGNGPFKKKAS